MAMVAQQPVLFNTTVEANVAYGLKVRGIRGCRDRVAKALEWVGLADFRGRRALTLSGGEAQRVAIARAAILEPEILFLDEPTANLDPSNVALIEDLIRDVADRGASVVLVTHNLFQARRLGHQATFLLGGQAVESGSARQVLERPREAQTLAFIEGKMVC
jgi:tungstate transport system ATP-binding protein